MVVLITKGENLEKLNLSEKHPHLIPIILLEI